jgi:hypothetical protein
MFRSGRFAARSDSCTPQGRQVSPGVDSLTLPLMGWLRKLFARLRGSRPTAEITPIPAPEPESTAAQPPLLSYRITVETAEGGEETHHYSRPGLPVTKDESIDLGEGRYATVLEVVEEAQPGVKDGIIRANSLLPRRLLHRYQPAAEHRRRRRGMAAHGAATARRGTIAPLEEGSSRPDDRVPARADQGFADPVALSSTKPGNFPASALRQSPYSLRAGLQPNRAPWSAQPGQ